MERMRSSEDVHATASQRLILRGERYRTAAACACKIGSLSVAITLDPQVRFFQTQRRYTDLNQAEHFFPAGFFASSGPAIPSL